ncbi:MAG TPA: alpha-glucan family phosphorylase [Elusimicrobiales bacterium]|nr:alpha-glucan family phosphorylase [Elusimicrobiales bacterium]
MKIKSFNVIPNLPENLKALDELSTNMWFTWNWDAIMMFVGINEELWHRSHRNPKWILGTLPPERLEELSRDQNFLGKLGEIQNKFESYIAYKDTWFAKNRQEQDKDMQVAYFSMEYGIGEGLPIYSGGLGMLSGDHLKSSSDMGLPLVGVGLLYKKGYVQQVLNRDNWQVERYPENDWYNMPVQIVKDAGGRPLRVEVDLAGEKVKIGVWKVPVGRTSLFLLDTDLPENTPQVRLITEQLYGGDRENRIRQEIVLGIGGARALEAMGLRPTVYHINEGHSAFLLFERISQLMKSRGLSYPEAREVVWASSVFTTHTPVMAGNEHFDFELVRKYLEIYSRELGLTFPEFLEIGKEEATSMGFCMTVVAMRLCAFLNGVSLLHRDVSRDMWHKLWPQLPRYEIPIEGITNGVHTCSWISHEHHQLYSKHLAGGGNGVPDSCDFGRMSEIDDREFWDTHMVRKQKLVKLVRERLKRQHQRLAADPTVLAQAEKVLNPDYLTIGFARRFATYKRATLFMRDLERLMELVCDEKMPVQFVFAGKSHQADAQGKEYIKAVAKLSMDKRFKSRIIFVEDYNMNVARYMVQGVDVWMNNPIRPLEASGTSGMKAAANGVMNLSVLDGWWVEGYSPDVGWAIGGTEAYNTDEERDYVEAEAIYNLIKKVIAPLYYDRGDDGLPHAWVKMMKACAQKLIPHFNTNRMLREYYEKFYLHAHRSNKKFAENSRVVEFAGWRRKLAENWPQVKVVTDQFKPEMEIHSGAKLPVRAVVWLGDLTPEDVDVQLHVGTAGGETVFKEGRSVSMTQEARMGDSYVYKGEVLCAKSGRHDFSVRVIGRHPDAVNALMPLYIKWSDD